MMLGPASWTWREKWAERQSSQSAVMILQRTRRNDKRQIKAGLDLTLTTRDPDISIAALTSAHPLAQPKSPANRLRRLLNDPDAGPSSTTDPGGLRPLTPSGRIATGTFGPTSAR